MVEANSVADRKPLPWFCTLTRIPLASELGPFWRNMTFSPSISPVLPAVHQLSFEMLTVRPVCAVWGPFTPLPRALAVTVSADSYAVPFRATGPTLRDFGGSAQSPGALVSASRQKA